MRVSLTDINERAFREPTEFMIRCDRAYDEKVAAAAEAISKSVDVCPIVLISGPSGSGKTTTARKLETELERRGIMTHSLSMDDYYKDLDIDNCPRTEDGKLNLESPELLDLELLNEHFKALTKGEMVRVPRFDFVARKRSNTKFEELRLGDREVAIVEGIHALNDGITAQNPDAFTIFIAPENEIEAPDGSVFLPQWSRLLRRSIRDARTRGADIYYTLELWGNVMRGEMEFIRPFSGKAKMTFNTSIDYEMPVLMTAAHEMLTSVRPDAAGFEHLAPILPWVESFTPMDPNLVGPYSLIAEFLGGSAYEG